MPRPASQAKSCSSTRMRISSATAMAGCVSLSWIGGMSASVVERAELAEMAADDVLQRGRGEEILLPQPQLLPGGRGVVRIEHARDGFGLRAGGRGADDVAAIEARRAASGGRARRPQPQRVDVTAAPAGDRRVVRHRQHRLGRIPDRARRCRRRRRHIRPRRRSRRDIVRRAARIPTDCRARASPPDIPAASRRGCAARTGRARSGCRSRRRESPSAAMLSMKQAASRPRPPLPSAASGSSSAQFGRDRRRGWQARARAGSTRRRLISVSNSSRPIRNSIDR